MLYIMRRNALGISTVDIIFQTVLPILQKHNHFNKADTHLLSHSIFRVIDEGILLMITIALPHTVTIEKLPPVVQENLK